MPHKPRKTRQQYVRARKRLLATATDCHWCHCPISQELPVGHPQKATADHVVPLSKAPPGYPVDSIENLVAACWKCNTRRGNRPPSSILPAHGASRKW